MSQYDELLRFWRSCEGLFQSEDDERENLERYLRRNPGLSLVVIDEGEIVATLKAGHDGRRGFLHHLAVRKDHRGTGLGRALVDRCLARLAEEGIRQVRAFVYDSNLPALAFWKHMGFEVMEYDYRTLRLAQPTPRR